VLLARPGAAGTRYAQTAGCFIPAALRCSALLGAAPRDEYRTTGEERRYLPTVLGPVWSGAPQGET